MWYLVVSQSISKRKKRAPNAKTRGVDKGKGVANLKEGEKLEVEFFNNGPVGKHQRDLVSHMGKLVRDRNIVPVEIHNWEEIGKEVENHLWDSILVSR